MVLDIQTFKNAMACFPSGVCVCTTYDESGRPWGFTASAFSSLSLDPPLLLVCLDKKADSHPAFRQAGHFGISILAVGQDKMAMQFASKGVEKFAGLPITEAPNSGVPLIAGAAAQMECSTHQHFDGGDHTIIVGEVLHAESWDLEPLLFFNRRFGHFTAD